MSIIGSIFGLIVITLIADNKGRKMSLIIGWILALIGCILMISSFNLPQLFLGNFLCGAGMYSTVSIIPVYLYEITCKLYNLKRR